MSRNFELLQRVATEQKGQQFDQGLLRAPKKASRPNPHALPHAELIRLIQRVFLLSGPVQQKVVVFAGVQNGTGCSSVLAGAGTTLAGQTDGTVCLVDANVQSPSLHGCFGVQNIVGLTDAMTDTGQIDNFVQKLPGDNLWLLPCGSNRSKLSAVVGIERFRNRMEELRSKFSYVLVDAPPVNGGAEAVLLGKLADGAVLIVEANVTRREAARIAKEMFETAQVRLLGAVLNKRTFPIPASLYRRL